MRGGALPPGLLCAALGLALGFAPGRVRWAGTLLAAGLALAAAFCPAPRAWTDAMFAAVWVSVAATAMSVHLPGGLPRIPALVLSANAGLWSGLLIHLAGTPYDLGLALPWLLLCWPAGELASRRFSIAVKVAASWLIAVALLAAFLPVTTPTPGYAPDHMD